MFRPILLVALCITFSTATHAKDNKKNAPENITLTVPSPHLPWAKPLAAPPLRILFIAPRYTLRDVVELAQRFDIKYDTVGLWSNDQLEEPGTDPHIAATLDTLLQKPFDVIVAGNFDLALLPENTQQALLQQVSEGTGLFLTHHRIRNDGPLKDALFDLEPTGPNPAFAADTDEAVALGILDQKEDITTAPYGLGQITQVHYPGRYPLSHFLVGVPAAHPPVMENFLDNALSFVANTLRWAANHTPARWIANIRDGIPPPLAKEEIPPGFTDAFVRAMQYSASYSPTRPFIVTLDQPADALYEVSAKRQAPEAPYLWGTFAKGTLEQPVHLIAEPGYHQINVSLRNKKGIVDWFRKPLLLTDWPELLGVTMEQESLLPNDTINLEIFVAEAITATTPRKCTIIAEATELNGRTVAIATKTLTPEGEMIPLRLSLADLQDHYVKIEVFALEGELTAVPPWRRSGVAPWRQYLPVKQTTNQKNFHFVISTPSIAEPNLLHYARTLHSLGADALATPHEELAPLNTTRTQLTLIEGTPFVAIGAPTPRASAQLRTYQNAHPYNGLSLPNNFNARTPEFHQWLPWYTAMHQLPALWAPNPFGNASNGQYGALYPDGRTTPSFSTLANTLRTIKETIGPILRAATWNHAGIAIRDTQNQTEAKANHSLDTFITTLENLGYQYDLINQQEIQRGNLVQYQLLILPKTGPLDENLSRTIKAYANAGGTIIADNENPAPHDQPTENFLHINTKQDFRPTLENLLNNLEIHPAVPLAATLAPARAPASPSRKRWLW